MDATALRWFMVGTRSLGLTPREAEAMFATYRVGNNHAAIARAMCCSRTTARNHVHRVRRKLGCGDRGLTALVVRLWPYYATAAALARHGG